MAVHSYLQLLFQEIWFPLLAYAGSRTQVVHIHAGNTPTHKIKIVSELKTSISLYHNTAPAGSCLSNGLSDFTHFPPNTQIRSQESPDPPHAPIVSFEGHLCTK